MLITNRPIKHTTPFTNSLEDLNMIKQAMACVIPLALSLWAAVPALAQDEMQNPAQDAIQNPGQKTIGAPKSKVEPSLIVMNAAGATLAGDKLTLSGAAPNSIIFADRPV